MKKKLIVLLLCLTMASSMSGCGSSISQEDYDSLKSKNSDLQSVNDSLQTEYDSLQTEYDSLKKEFDEYKEKMKPYEEMEEAQAEAAKVKAEQEKAAAEKAAAEQAAAEQAAAEKAAAEQAEAAAAEEAKGYETGITYEQLARTPDDFVGKKVKFSGKVLQVMEGDSETQIRLAVNDDYDTVIYCGFTPSIISSRILEDDEITIYGSSIGLYSYQSTLGGTITLPALYVNKIDQ